MHDRTLQGSVNYPADVELVEREGALAALASWLGEAGTGAGRLALVAGEAGIGKTSLVQTFCDEHADEARVWWGSCDALSTPRPLGPLHDIARMARGELSSLMASDASRHERFSGFLEALSWPLQPTIAVFEDVHWADEATRDLLVFVARRVADVNAMVVLTYRDDEVGSDHPLRQVLGSVATLDAARRLVLPRLSPSAVTALAAASQVDGQQVYRVTGGNPFFVTEVLAGDTGQVPDTVRDAVLARAGRLSRSARSVLEAAAVVPDRVEIELVRTVAMGGDTEAIEECVKAGLLLTTGRSLKFRHELARLAVEGSVSGTRQPGLHAAVLGYLSEQTGADPARLAYHAEQAGDRDAVLTHAPVAGERASRLGAHREAAVHYERALAHAEGIDPHDRAALLDHHADECTAIDDETAALVSYDGAVTAWREVGDPERTATALARRAYALWGVGRNEEARVSVEEATSLLEHRPPGLALATTYTYSAHLHMLARQIPPAIELGQRAVAIAEDHHDVALLGRALNIVGAAQWFVDPDQAERTLARALEAAHRSGDDTIVGVVMRMLGSGSGEVRRYDVADHWLREGIRWCAEHDLDIHGDYCLAWLARSCFELGRWTEAGEVASEAAGRPSQHAPTRIVALTALGRLRIRRGDTGADAPLSEAWDLAHATGDLQRLWPAAAGRAEAAWLAGRPDDIAGLVTETFELAVRLGQAWPVGELGFWLWRAGELRIPPEGAATPFALQIAGDWRAAAHEWERIGCPYEVAVALADGDEPDELRRAFTILAGLGAAPMTDRVAAKLRGSGVHDLPRRPSRATADNPAGLTGRQLEVLGQLAEGRTNTEIGAALHISPKTVGHHVSAILDKLGVADRREAARLARDRGLIGP
jgi:DNA-binding CsgD family transcriptional regulator/tetratricopeptide (TPR) repeat protein